MKKTYLADNNSGQIRNRRELAYVASTPLILKSSLLLFLLAPDGMRQYERVDLLILANFILDLLAFTGAYILFKYSRRLLKEWYKPALYVFAGMVLMIIIQDVELIEYAVRLDLI